MYLLFRLRQDNRTVLAGKELRGVCVVGKEGVDVQVRIGEKLHIVLMFPEIRPLPALRFLHVRSGAHRRRDRLCMYDIKWKYPGRPSGSRNRSY